VVLRGENVERIIRTEKNNQMRNFDAVLKCDARTAGVDPRFAKRGPWRVNMGLGLSPQRDSGQSPWWGEASPEAESLFVYFHKNSRQKFRIEIK